MTVLSYTHLNEKLLRGRNFQEKMWKREWEIFVLEKIGKVCSEISSEHACFSMKAIGTLTSLLFARTRIVPWIERILIGQYRNIWKKREREKHYAWNGRKRDCSKTTWPFCVVTCRPELVNIVVLSPSRAKAAAIRYLKRI